MSMEVVQVLQHLGHDHPLMLIKPEETDDSWDLSCYGCEQPISILSSSSSSSYYGCKRCVFFLHKTCAELPDKMTHPSHPQHPLTLLPNPNSSGVWTCDVCNKKCNRFFYHCDDCDYDIDMKCAVLVLSIQKSIDHTSHPHQLILLQRESMFLCDGCGIKHEGTSLLCTTCGFWINQKCASSPINLKLDNHHDHTLSLFYSVPWQYYWPRPSNETVNESHDLGLNPIKLSSSNSGTATSDADLHKVICLPVPDDPADIITQFIKNTAIQGKHEGAAKIKHGSHNHPLTLYEEPIDHASSHLNVAWNVQKCSGCAQSISAPFYCCVECEFYLHVWCAELPEKLPHPGHPQHTLFLSKEATAGKCNCCNLYGSTISYKCEECNFHLDCKCASLPRVIKHESHDKHILALRPTSFSGTCKSCSASLTISFQCWGCKFNLCVRCAILPRTVRHRYDKHPFTLTYSPRPYQTDDDFCEICEEGMDSNRWFYHCEKCDQYLHTDCILPDDQFSNMVYFRYWKPINNRKHPHRLIRVDPRPYTSCSLCQRSNADSNHYRCPPCGFRLCDSCLVSDEDFRVICLPVPDDSADIITQFIKNTAVQGKHKGAAEINHGSHDHPLTLYEEPIDHASSHFNVALNVPKCCGCAQSISAPFYCCLECKFCLHVWCAELPVELRHPAHFQHTLLLSKTARTGKCECCNLFASTLLYGCEECYFYLDYKCASLPRVIKHESHDNHTLALRPTPSSGTCKSCSASLRISFDCWGCKFNLCIRCAILPRTVQHRFYDRHPFTLTYSPHLYRTDGDFCKICEDGIDTSCWFYHCGECDRYLHTDCILPVDQFSNMVYDHLEKPINSRKHPHRLFWAVANPNTSCSLCGRSNADSDHYLCPPCQFRLCFSCEEKEIEGEI
ncbi:hypothetical protein RHSIM_Rhsim03G0013400 [Rhododendron simsii]|uniref:Zinc finger PHD-type domain-containing protein n=1 Tax=Rhododendron simsii TaxID=118357 RepID=A0A834H850_RHOSS|nr:hypothetical protein RHSIM_Rhsim03G0013400 [Rhododendron simsii]